MLRTRRVVVTGVGAVTALGLTASSTWDALCEGRSGADEVTGIDPTDLPVRIAAQVKGFDGDGYFGRRRARHLDRVTQLALVATNEAVEASKLDIAADPTRVAVVYGTGIGGLASIEEGGRTLVERGPEWMNPYLLPMSIANMLAGQIAIDHGIQGYSSCPVTACSASAQAIGESMDLIRLGRADAAVCGGSEAAVTRLGLSGFAAMKALSTRNDDPKGASRPFDLHRDGFLLGEAAATLVLEERESALRRGAPILAELGGWGSTSDAYHVTAPRPDGDGAVRSMLEACKDADITPDQIGYINAHGTSTVPNDKTESLAVRRIWGDDAPPTSSTKSMTGHTLGAAGALESIFCIQAMQTGILPPTINLQTPDPDCDLDYVPNEARAKQVDVAITNSFGFGGHNASVVWRRV
ncbi:MAG TPA: beta-ketoacyl-ACP synthase II [Acidimicrobiales bacterium]|nr:beta-ketoacyl-ACP synthase II [Acidimicrobiales bacterium]